MHLLGIANGSLGGNSEILLKAALKAASDTDPSLTTSWLHAPSVSVPLNPPALQGSFDMGIDMLAAMRDGSSNSVDDRPAVLNAILDADAIIFATPVYSHQPAGMLKALLDRILGPFTDAAFATRAAEAQARGDPQARSQALDTRILKPRVVGFMAVAGSTTPDQVSMALPTLHVLVYSLHAKVVDQAVLTGCAAPGAVIYMDDGQAITRAQQLGHNVASQMGKPFDQALYLGPHPRGACPNCHLLNVELSCNDQNAISCVACGTEGRIETGDDGIVRPVWVADSTLSSITMAGKQRHVDDLLRNSLREAAAARAKPDAQRELEEWRRLQIPVVRLPSCEGVRTSL